MSAKDSIGYLVTQEYIEEKDRRIAELETMLSIEKRAHDLTVDNEEKLEGQIAELERERDELRDRVIVLQSEHTIRTLTEALRECRHDDCIATHYTFKCKCKKCAALEEVEGK